MINFKQFKEVLETLIPEDQNNIACAVSGGADSMCLLLCLQQWKKEHRPKLNLIALTIDHQLRPESDQEALQVAAWCKPLGIPHYILKWDHPQITGGLQAKAREARYALLTNYCKEEKIPFLFLAHHHDDQVETFLMRLRKGSGIDGLLGMQPISNSEGVKLCRPFLGFSHQDILETLKDFNHPFIKDPSNENTKFERIFWRKVLNQLPGSFNIEETQRRLCLYADFTKQELAKLVRKSCKYDALGFFSLDDVAFSESHLLLKKKILALCLHHLSPHKYLVEDKPLFDVIANLSEKPQTLRGCFILKKGHNIIICRELRAAPPMTIIQPGEVLLWDHRFEITNHSSTPFGIGPSKNHPLDLGKEYPPYLIRQTLPLAFVPNDPSQVIDSYPFKGKDISIRTIPFKLNI